MHPVIVTPPTAQPVGLEDMRAHLRVTYRDEDALIQQLMAAAVAHLDGWNGVLGRAIMSQTWSETFSGPGPYLLAMPDATVATATVDGIAASGVTTEATAAGVSVEFDSYGSETTIEYTCALPARLLPVAQIAVKLLVAHWFENRSAVGESMAALPMAVDAVLAGIRWRRI